MCLAVPAKLVEIDQDDLAVVEVDGARVRVGLNLIDEVQVGDYVLVHAGFAIGKIDADEAARTVELIKELERIRGSDEVR